MSEPRQTLAAALRAAAADLDREAPPPGLLARIHAAHTAQAAHAAIPLNEAVAAAPSGPGASGGGQATLPRRRGFGLPWSLPRPLQRGAAWGMACATVLAGSLVLMLQQPAPPAGPATLLASDFVPLLPPERWPAANGEAAPAWLVSAELSGERLAALGLPFDPARAGERVRAELLLHASGDVLAVRLLH
ncbi:MAG: hypothetical protein KF683_08445 [Rubrivivax sp.]|nr:hypothetical protein [Rubrivivax sp.]